MGAAMWIVLVYGVILRAVQYGFNRSLWLDELWLALNIIHRSAPDLLHRLDYDQAAPVGFLMTERLAIQSFGASEYVLRLFPFACGVAALFLFYGFAKSCFRPATALVALTLFAVSRHLIIYASQVKQYSGDLLFAVAITWAGFWFLERERTWRAALLFGLLGAVALWFSHAATLVLAGVGATLGVSAIVRRQWKRLGMAALAGSVWLISFAFSYRVFMGDLAGHERLIGMWHQGFMPFPPTSVDALKWFPKVFSEMLENPTGLTIPGLAALMLLAGAVFVYRASPERLAMLGAPIALALAASGFHRYLFLGRFLLFAAPALMLCIAQGLAWTIEATRPAVRWLGVALLVVLLAHPVLASAYHIYKPYTIEEMRAVMPYLKDHYQPGDLILMPCYNQYDFDYYGPRFGLEDAPRLVYPRFPKDFDEFIRSNEAALRQHRRAWFLFAAINDDVSAIPAHLKPLEQLGGRPGPSFERYSASVRLYEFDPASPGTG